MKPIVRLYPLDFDRLAWSQVADAPDGVMEKVVARDETGGITRFLKLSPETRLEPFTHEWVEETYVIEGVYTVNGEDYARGSYLCRRPEERANGISSASGATLFQVREPGDALDKESTSLQASDIEAMPWSSRSHRGEGFAERLLASGPSGSTTSLFQIQAGNETHEQDSHTCVEEVLILEGAYKDGDQFHLPGMYTCNPPGTIHGPFIFGELLVGLEIKNYL